jgi:hypothetical protein
MLVLCPATTTDRFKTGLGIFLRNVVLLRGQDRPRSQLTLERRHRCSRPAANPWCGPGGLRSWKTMVHIHGVSCGCPASALKEGRS